MRMREVSGNAHEGNSDQDLVQRLGYYYSLISISIVLSFLVLLIRV